MGLTHQPIHLVQSEAEMRFVLPRLSTEPGFGCGCAPAERFLSDIPYLIPRAWRSSHGQQLNNVFVTLTAAQKGAHYGKAKRFREAAESTGDGRAQIRIISLLPNRPGDDTENEEVTIKNAGSNTVNLAGWKLRDLAKQTWSLDSLSSLAQDSRRPSNDTGRPSPLTMTATQL